jgi:hypothetical protein
MGPSIARKPVRRRARTFSRCSARDLGNLSEASAEKALELDLVLNTDMINLVAVVVRHNDSVSDFL